MDVASWLRSLGLELRGRFPRDAITEKLLPSLTAEDLKDLGVSSSGIAVFCSRHKPFPKNQDAARWQPGYFSTVPRQTRGMQWRTYSRIRARGEAADTIALGAHLIFSMIRPGSSPGALSRSFRNCSALDDTRPSRFLRRDIFQRPEPTIVVVASPTGCRTGVG